MERSLIILRRNSIGGTRSSFHSILPYCFLSLISSSERAFNSNSLSLIIPSSPSQ
ncbi:unnamed protein product [Larinioides sclopetarius]|uniref:Uncharacterized protein n=1 Tax=Larinioides sclopetarius TaxID=280406 RepID=A0AAV1Z062_9ARAC